MQSNDENKYWTANARYSRDNFRWMNHSTNPSVRLPWQTNQQLQKRKCTSPKHGCTPGFGLPKLRNMHKKTDHMYKHIYLVTLDVMGYSSWTSLHIFYIHHGHKFVATKFGSYQWGRMSRAPQVCQRHLPRRLQLRDGRHVTRQRLMVGGTRTGVDDPLGNKLPLHMGRKLVDGYSNHGWHYIGTSNVTIISNQKETQA